MSKHRAAALVALLGALVCAPAGAAHFTVDQIANPDGTGTFTLNNTTAGLSATQLFVRGDTPVAAGTSRPGWQASAVFLDDPLSCLPGTGFEFTFPTGYCYKLTDDTAGDPLGAGAETFSFESLFALADPSDFFVLFRDLAGAAFACSGVTGAVGCDAPVGARVVPEPGSLGLIAGSLLMLGALRRRKAAIAGALKAWPGASMVRAALLVPAIISLTALSTPSEARITRIVIDQVVSPHYSGSAVTFNGDTAGSAGQYERITGRAFGEVDPDHRLNTIIQDLELAPKNANGRVEYVTTFTLIKPIDLTKASGVVFYHVPNRGGKIDPGVNGVFPGAMYLESGWQGDLAATSIPSNATTPQPILPQEGILVPRVTNPDGSPATGPVLVRFINQSGASLQMGGGLAGTFKYPPLTLDTTQAKLTSTASETYSGVSGPLTTIPSSDWAFANCNTTTNPFPGTPDPFRVCLKDGFSSSLLYTLTFTAKDPLVLGLGFAATRDLNSFFRNAAADDFGTPNPIANAVTHMIGRGDSQSGNFIKSLIHMGFLEDENGRPVWDAAWPNIAARQNPLNFRFALPGGAGTPFEPGSEPVLWWERWPDTVRGRPTAGMLDRCRASNTCPKIFETFGSTEFWNLRIGPGLVGTSADKDIPLPANIRRYYFPSTPHGGGGNNFNYNPATSSTGNCSLPNNANGQADQARALLVAMVDWVVNGREPPASVYPKLSMGQLTVQTRAAQGFPNIPGVTYTDNWLNAVLDYDFGSTFDYNDMSGIIAQQPPTIKQVIKTLVPKVNSDGNETSGVASVLLQAPLGTYLGWNITRMGFRAGQICDFTGGFMPFKVTQAERVAANDPRRSLQERYGTHDGYVCAVKIAAKKASASRFLLERDVDRIVTNAQNGNVLVGVAASTADMSRAAFFCAAANASPTTN